MKPPISNFLSRSLRTPYIAPFVRTRLELVVPGAAID